MENNLLLEKYLEVQEKYEEYFHPYPEYEMGEYIFTFYNVDTHPMMDILGDLEEWLDEQIQELDEENEEFETLNTRLFQYVEDNKIHGIETGTEEWLELISHAINYNGTLNELLEENIDGETMDIIFRELEKLDVDVY